MKSSKKGNKKGGVISYKASQGKMMKVKKVKGALEKASKLHAAQAKTLGNVLKAAGGGLKEATKRLKAQGYTGGNMALKNPKKADLDKDGKLSGYEMKRGKAIEENMGVKKGKMIKAVLGVAALATKKGREQAKKIMKGKTKLSPAMNYLGRDMGGEIKGYGQARSKGMGLQDESVPMKDNSYIKDLI
jgi:hypothetical protein